jgi:hypothetical protein
MNPRRNNGTHPSRCPRSWERPRLCGGGPAGLPPTRRGAPPAAPAQTRPPRETAPHPAGRRSTTRPRIPLLSARGGGRRCRRRRRGAARRAAKTARGGGTPSRAGIPRLGPRLRRGSAFELGGAAVAAGAGGWLSGGGEGD